MSHFSTALKATAEELGLTQLDIAHVTGIDGSRVSRLMSGRLAPSLDTLRAIATRLDPEHDHGLRLVVAALRDVCESVEGGPGKLEVRLAPEAVNIDSWWSSLPEQRRARYRAFEDAAVASDKFESMLASLHPFALRYLGLLFDAQQLNQAHASRVVQMRSEAVAEDPPPQPALVKSAPPEGGRSKATATLPHGRSQQPAV